MKSWCVNKINNTNEYGIFIRDYSCQGVNPDYSLFKVISRETAECLVANKLAEDTFNIFKTFT